MARHDRAAEVPDPEEIRRRGEALAALDGQILELTRRCVERRDRAERRAAGLVAEVGLLAREYNRMRTFAERLLAHHERLADHACDWRADFEAGGFPPPMDYRDDLDEARQAAERAERRVAELEQALETARHDALREYTANRDASKEEPPCS